MTKIVTQILFIIILFLSSDIKGESNSFIKSDTSKAVDYVNNTFITFNPLQLAYGELLTGIEKRKSETIFNVYRLGFIYSFGKYYGLHLEYGKKAIIGHNFYRTISFLAKYEYENYEMELDDWGIFSNKSLILRNNKYVLGAKVVYSMQTSSEHKIIADFYFGFGLRLHYYQKGLDFEMPNPANSIIVPSVHLGVTLMYNLNKK